MLNRENGRVQRRSVLTGLGAAALLASAGASKAYFLSRAKSLAELRLADYQTADGLITTFKAGKSTVADPYFGMFGIELARRNGLNTQPVGQRAMHWWLSVQQPNGRFEKSCGQPGALSFCGRSDSDDATLARWLQVLAEHAPRPWSPEVRNSFEKTYKALLALRLPNGVYSVFAHDTPGYQGYALFNDNIDVLNAFEMLAQAPSLQHLPHWHSRFASDAQALRAAMERVFGRGPDYFPTLALGAKYSKETFYPHHVAMPLAWMEGYVRMEPADKRTLWRIWLHKYEQEWIRFGNVNFPWGLVAVAAVNDGLVEVGAAWLERVAPLRRRDERWNVLEEICAQIILHKLRTV